ncbi:uncharacterized protein CEXT_488631 [Caerostris extrusa]|uniref:Uncharacterized protein n=1 Tax=Caerostris extrusa TaxID=172846 RepID=A0AAV4PIX8_CAEEX|nr:uncharacterized protein CEXT_488631 [Caerostris extrusa]
MGIPRMECHASSSRISPYAPLAGESFYIPYGTGLRSQRSQALIGMKIKASFPKCEVLGENQDISGSGLRPDLFLKHKQDYYLVDVTVPFENRCAALHAAHQRKVDKYQPVLEVLKNQGIKATVIPFVVGALGTWNPPNDAFMRKFCSKSYLNLFRKLCVSDTIKWSRDIYIEHLTGHRQFSEGDFTLSSQPVD